MEKIQFSRTYQENFAEAQLTRIILVSVKISSFVVSYAEHFLIQREYENVQFNILP